MEYSNVNQKYESMVRPTLTTGNESGQFY